MRQALDGRVARTGWRGQGRRDVMRGRRVMLGVVDAHVMRVRVPIGQVLRLEVQ